MDETAQNRTLSTKHPLFVDEPVKIRTFSSKQGLFVEQLAKYCTFILKTPPFCGRKRLFLPVGRLQSVRSAFTGAIRDEKCRFSFRTALFKPLGPARALGKTLICNHLIINIVVKSHLPGEAKLVSPGRP